MQKLHVVATSRPANLTDAVWIGLRVLLGLCY